MTDQITMQEFVKRVAERTHGTKGDPLSMSDVEQVVHATLTELYGPKAVEGLAETGIYVGMTDDRIGPEPEQPTPDEPLEVDPPDDEAGEAEGDEGR